MDPKLFKPSIDWGHAFSESLVWVAMAWAISAVCVIAVLAVLRVVAPWERQFWEIVDRFYNPDLFHRDHFGNWVLKDPPWKTR